MKYKFLLVASFLVFTLFSLHAYVEANKLYFAIPWFDIVMHMFGGFAVVFGCLATYHFYPRKVDTLSFCIGTLLAVLVVGSFWELYEITLDNLAQVNRFDLVDMTSDLINDVIGAALALFIIITKKYHEK